MCHIVLLVVREQVILKWAIKISILTIPIIIYMQN